MDAAYLQKHVSAALTEALLGMAVHQPDDPVEFVGQYLIEFVRRSEQAKWDMEEMKVAVERAEEESKRVDQLESDRRDKLVLQSKHEEKLKSFLRNLPTAHESKVEVMDSVTAFVSEYLGVPASYVAVKRVVEETDTLYYSSSNAEQRALLVGKKLAKVEFDEEDPIVRQGIAFDAFIVPEEDEVAVDEDADENFVAPPPPKAAPLLVANTMREKRLKFFGIPQLGSFLAVPLKFQSVDHDKACEIAPEEEAEEEAEGQGEAKAAEDEQEKEEGGDGEEPKEAAVSLPVGKKVRYAAVRQEVELLLCVDTVGAYRSLTPSDVALVSGVGEAMVARFEAIETELFARHVEALAEFSAVQPALDALTAAMAEKEVRALEAVEKEFTKEPPAVEEKAEGEEEEEKGESEEKEEEPREEEEEEAVPESLRPYREALGVYAVWAETLTENTLVEAVGMLQKHLLPAPAPAVALVRLAALLSGASSESLQDAFGECTWETLRTVRTLARFC